MSRSHIKDEQSSTERLKKSGSSHYNNLTWKGQRENQFNIAKQNKITTVPHLNTRWTDTEELDDKPYFETEVTRQDYVRYLITRNTAIQIILEQKEQPN